MAKTLRRKDLKEPDEFLTRLQQLAEYAEEHERQLTALVIVLVVAVALVVGIRWYRSSQEAKAEAAFGAARRDFSAQRLESAAAGFSRVSSTWPDTRYGRLALIYLGNSQALLGKAKEAEAAFRESLSRSDNDLLRQIAHYNLGLLEVKNGQAKSGAEQLTAATDIEGPLRGVAWFARLASQQKFTENVGQGMQAIDELSPDAREYVEAQIAAQAKAAAQ